MNLRHDPSARIGVIFATPLIGGGMIVSENFKKFYEENVKSVKRILEERFPDIEFLYDEAGTASDVLRALKRMSDVDGYLVFVLRHLTGVLRPILRSGKPTVIIAETYTGAGELMMEYKRIIDEGLKAVGKSTRNILDPELITKYVKILKTIHQLKNSKLLVITDQVVSQYMNAAFPMAVGIYNVAGEIRAIFGAETVIITSNEFNEKFYDQVSEASAEKIAEKWLNEARSVIGHEKKDLIGDAKMYLALKKAVEHYNADGVAVDCWTLFSSGLIKAWPCLGFMELSKEGIVCGCEADLTSCALMMLMKYLADIPGFITDPSIDEDRDEVIYYHCFSPVNMLGYHSNDYLPYMITTAHWGEKKGSIYVELPTGKKATLVGLNIVDRTLVIHEAEIIGNEYNEKECSTKAIGKVVTKNLMRNWEWRAGWHRVLFYGDWREILKEIGALLGLKVVEEDRPD
ncbi:MAG: hypothetical protein QXW39_09210 [Candidatus Bathyarchaeia archaeon]